MDKLAQKRSLRSKMWENVNLTGKALEGLHKELGEVMDEMRRVDENIRNIAEDVKPLIRQAKSSVRQRDYLNAAFSVSEFHRRVRHISHLLGKFATGVNVKHYQYLLDQFDPSNRDALFNYNPNAEIKEACDQFETLLKEAGPMDWVKEKATQVSDIGANIFTDTGRARKLLEKRFSASFIKQLKDQTQHLVKYSEKMMNDLLNTFDVLETGISRRNVGLYVQKAEDFVKKFNSYHKSYVDYDAKVLQQLKAYQSAQDQKMLADKMQQEEVKQKQEEIRQQQEQQVVDEARKSPLVQYVDPAPEQSEVELAPDYKEPTFKEWKEQQAQKELEEEKKQVLNKLEKELDKEDNTKAANQDFIDKITVLGEQDNVVEFVQAIFDHSDVVSDPELGEELMLIASSVISDYKQAGIFDFLKKDKPVEQQEEIKQETPVAKSTPKEKPQELNEQRENLFKIKKLDIPEGNIDKAYTDIPLLAAINPSRIRITGDAANAVMGSFARGLAAQRNIDDLKPYVSDIETKLIPALKQAVYDGWVVSVDNVFDDHNPHDKYINVYTRLNISNIIPSLTGIAKLNISCRVSANHNTTTIRGIKKNFTIENVKPKNTPQIEENEDLDDSDNGQHDDYHSQYDE